MRVQRRNGKFLYLPLGEEGGKISLAFQGPSNWTKNKIDMRQIAGENQI